MSEIERAIAYPPAEIPMLKWWENEYDFVFVALNPFFRVPGFSPRTAAFGPRHFDIPPLSAEETVELLLNRPPRENNAPADFRDTIKSKGIPVRWADVNSAVGSYDFKEFCLAVWMSTLEITRNDANSEIVANINRFSLETDLYFPEEDMLPILHEIKIGEMLEICSIFNVTIESNILNQEKLININDFIDRSTSVRLVKSSRLDRLYDAKRKLLVCNDYDDISTIIAMKAEIRERARPEEFFEGFYASHDTYCDWMNSYEWWPNRVHYHTS